MIDKKLIDKLADDLDKYAEVHGAYNRHMLDKATQVAMDKVGLSKDSDEGEKLKTPKVDLFAMDQVNAKRKKSKKDSKDKSASPAVRADSKAAEFYLNLAVGSGLLGRVKSNE